MIGITSSGSLLEQETKGSVGLSSGRTDLKTAALPLPTAAEVRFKDYLLENVYLCTTPAQRSEIIALWKEEGAIADPAEAKRRCREAVFLVRASSGELAGLSTVGFLRV